MKGLCPGILLSMSIAIPTAFSQTEVAIGPARPESPKKVVFELVQWEDPVALAVAAADGQKIASIPLEKFAGFEIVLEQNDQKFVSSPIAVQGPQGSCSIANVPPGKYTLILSWLKLRDTFLIPKLPVNSLTVEIRLGGSGIRISAKDLK